jgi:carbamoyl-phosphate synthase large subunit
VEERVAVLLTGVGKRYDIVSAFAEHAFVVAADPSPLAPARYAAHVRAAPRARLRKKGASRGRGRPPRQSS